MRIRKRQVGLPLSSLSPVPLSDPYTHSASSGSLLPPVQLLRPTTPAAVDGINKNSKLSDQAATNQPPIGGPDTIDHTVSCTRSLRTVLRHSFLGLNQTISLHCLRLKKSFFPPDSSANLWQMNKINSIHLRCCPCSRLSNISDFVFVCQQEWVIHGEEKLVSNDSR